MKNKLRSFMVLAALAVCFGTFSVTAYAQSNEPQTEPAPVEETTEPEETAEPNPFTPNGTGTVLDNATSEDEKEFYTIVTEDENVFYLVIDKQRDTENVYFLNAVTESDLMALAESKLSFLCVDRSCGFTMWKNSRFFTDKHKELTKAVASALLKKGRVKMTGLFSEKKGMAYDATVVLDDTGKYVNYKLEFDQKKAGAKHE